MKPMTRVHSRDVGKFKLKNREVEKQVERPEFRKNLSSNNLIRSRIELELVDKNTEENSQTSKNSQNAKKFDTLKRKIAPSAIIRIPDLLELNQNIKRQTSFDGSHLSHFMKAMEDHSVDAKKSVMKPACDGLTWYITLFECER